MAGELLSREQIMMANEKQGVNRGREALLHSGENRMRKEELGHVQDKLNVLCNWAQGQYRKEQVHYENQLQRQSQ